MTNRIMRDISHGIRAIALSAVLGSILGAATFMAVESLFPAMTYADNGALIDLTVEG